MSQEENLYPVKFTLKSGAIISAFVKLSAKELMDDPDYEEMIDAILHQQGFFKTTNGCALIVGSEIAAIEWDEKPDA